jgi:serine protease Do
MNSRIGLSFSAIVLAALAPWTLHAAADGDANTVNTALRAEEELTKIIEKANAAFVFVGGGSGIVVSPDGYILTNHHVAGDRKQWTVRIHGSNKLAVCDLVGTDPVGDLALLKARNAKDLAYVEFGEISKVRVGQQVLAVGDPFKLADLDGPPSVSIGTVSALHRFQGNYSDAIQTDCAINPGNSGGPLLTLDGKLIGITGQIMSRFGAKANTGIGYAIPVDQILRFYSLLQQANGRVVYHGTLPEGLTFSNRVDETQNASIETVDAGSEAQQLGFLAGDRVVCIDNKTVHNYARLVGIVRSYPENSLLEFQVERNSKLVNLKVKLPRMSLPAGMSYSTPLGAKLQLREKGEGVRVMQVDKGSAADRAGLLIGDIITSVDGKSPSIEWSEILLAKKAGQSISVQIKRAGPDGYEQKVLSVPIESK